MSKRERIILILMALVVVYGLYVLLYSAPSKPGAPSRTGESKDLNRFIIDMANQITDNTQTKTDEYIVAKASSKWEQNPFSGLEPVVKSISNALETQKRKAPIPERKALVYTGYLSIGGSTMAIINGRERKTGDVLEPTVFYVKKIFPTRVEIGIQGESDTVILPLEKPDGHSMTPNFRDGMNEGETR
jgi:hypothetical protein